MNQEYIKPTVSSELGRSDRDAAVDRNYLARGNNIPTLVEIDGIPVKKLTEEFGSPLFVYSAHSLRTKARRMREAFQSRYEKVEPLWPLKVNYLGAICEVMHREGWGAEVVSDFEYEKARNQGFEAKEVVFNGPYKQQDALVRALEERALVQIDNWDELNRIADIVEDWDIDKPIDVGIRVWLDAGIRPVWSKFGFALENGEAERAADRIAGNKKLRLHTIHTHIGTYILLPEAYRVATRKLVALRERLFNKHDGLVDCLNLGGGFPSNSLLHLMEGPAEKVIQPIEAYAEAITDVLNKLPKEKRPILRLETGRHLVDEAGYLLTRVVASKGMKSFLAAGTDLSGGAFKEQRILGLEPKSGYVVDAGINMLYTAAWYRMNIMPARQVKAPLQPSRIYGSLCMAIDVIRESIDLPPLDVGDILTLHPVGAYNLVQSMQFISYRPPVVMIDEAGKPEIIREKETLDDVIGPERMPPSLSKT